MLSVSAWTNAMGAMTKKHPWQADALEKIMMAKRAMVTLKGILSGPQAGP